MHLPAIDVTKHEVPKSALRAIARWNQVRELLASTPPPPPIAGEEDLAGSSLDAVVLFAMGQSGVFLTSGGRGHLALSCIAMSNLLVSLATPACPQAEVGLPPKAGDGEPS